MSHLITQTTPDPVHPAHTSGSTSPAFGSANPVVDAARGGAANGNTEAIHEPRPEVSVARGLGFAGLIPFYVRALL